MQVSATVFLAVFDTPHQASLRIPNLVFQISNNQIVYAIHMYPCTLPILLSIHKFAHVRIQSNVPEKVENTRLS